MKKKYTAYPSKPHAQDNEGEHDERPCCIPEHRIALPPEDVGI